MLPLRLGGGVDDPAGYPAPVFAALFHGLVSASEGGVDELAHHAFPGADLVPDVASIDHPSFNVSR